MKRGTLTAGARPRKCKVCREKFTPRSSLQVACGPSCALTLAKETREKAERKEARKRKAGLKTRRDLLAEAQQAFNAFIRERDHALPCVSCGTTEAKWDAGHYRSVGACPELRFNPLNVHKQCAQCNTHKSGNAIEYRIGLVARIGAEAVAFLEGPHEPARLAAEELERMKTHYRAEARRLKKAREQA